jgi:hypothetical protein
MLRSRRSRCAGVGRDGDVTAGGGRWREDEVGVLQIIGGAEVGGEDEEGRVEVAARGKKVSTRKIGRKSTRKRTPREHPRPSEYPSP